MGRHGFPGIPRRFGMQLPLVAMVLREASALMRISSYVLNAYLYCVYALVGGAISIRDPYICAVSLVCANESHAVFHGPVVCAVKT